MSHTKRAIEDIRALGWPVNNESLAKLLIRRKQLEEINGTSIRKNKKRKDPKNLSR